MSSLLSRFFGTTSLARARAIREEACAQRALHLQLVAEHLHPVVSHEETPARLVLASGGRTARLGLAAEAVRHRALVAAVVTIPWAVGRAGRRGSGRAGQPSVELAPTSTNKINVDLLARDSPSLARTLAPIRNPAEFVRLFDDVAAPDTSPASRKHRPLSRGMLTHVDALEAYEVVEPTAPHVLEMAELSYSPLVMAILTTVWCVCFLVPKKNRRQGRFVADCRPINKKMAAKTDGK